MKETALHFALRETRRHFGDTRVLAALAIVAGTMGFSGPFGTFDRLPTAPRVAYWAAIVVVTYAVGYFVAVSAGRSMQARGPVLRAILVGLLVGPPVTLVVIVINWLSFGFSTPQPVQETSLLAYCTAIAIGVTSISELVAASVRRGASPTAPQEADRAASVEVDASNKASHIPLLERVPVHLRAPLVSISVSDHYVEIVTRKGRALVLMRFGDAVREAGAVPGLRIHRSHWIALDAVKDVTRRGGRVTVELGDGRLLPVSRSFLTDAKEAGLLA